MESIVTYHATKVSPQEVQRKAEEQYAGGYFCCEAVMSVIRDAFQADVPESVIAMSSGMSIGAGRSGCMCGALNGGILALGMFFGRHRNNGLGYIRLESIANSFHHCLTAEKSAGIKLFRIL